MRQRAFLLGIAALLINPIWAPVRTSGQTQKPWKARYVSGNEPIQEGRKLAVSLGADLIDMRGDKGERLLIPTDRVTGVFYDNLVNNRGLDVIRGMARSTPQWATPTDCVACNLIGYGVVGGAVALVLSPFHSKDHFAHLVWRRENAALGAIVELGKNDYQDFLAELSAVTGKPWLDLSR